MLVSYFIPEDGDSPQHPNVFSCEATGLTLQDLKKAFPVPGIYHFRALKAVGDMKVWLDLVSDSATVPAYRGEVVLKVTRISLGRGSNTPIASSSPSKQSSQQRVAPSQVDVNVEVEVSEEKQTPQSSQSQQGKGPVARMAAPERRGSEKLLSFDTFDDSNTTPPASTASPFDSNAGDVFDFSTQDSQQKQQTQAPQHQRNNSNNSMNDFMNFPASTSTPPPMMNNSMQGGMGGMGNMSGMGGGMNRGGGSSGNINGMMNSSNARQQQQQQQQKNRNAMGGIDPFGNFN